LATVITNLLSAVPFFGQDLVELIWGGFSVSNATLNRFFSLHFLLPFLVVVLAAFHLFFLHASGRSNPLGTPSATNKVPFHYYFSAKDSVVFLLFLFVLMVVTLIWGYDLMDAENWIPANPMVTPTHIQPEWYFLFAYAILRSIPNKLGGVVGLAGAVLCLFLYPIGAKGAEYTGFRATPGARILFWRFVRTFLLLTWLGSCPARDPFNGVALALTRFFYLLVAAMVSFNK